MPDLTARLLAEIERREGERRRWVRKTAEEHRELAYLAALRAIVDLHGEWHICRTDDDPGLYEKHSEWAGEECSTLAAVAEGLGVTS